MKFSRRNHRSSVRSAPSWTRRILRLFLLFGPALLMPLEPAGSYRINAEAAAAQESQDAYEEELEKARELLRQREYDEALKCFKRANSMKGKASAACYWGMALAYQGLEENKKVLECCEKVVEFAGEDTALKAQAYNAKGVALQELAEGKNTKRLQQAEAEFRQALAQSEEMAIVHFNLGIVLMQMNRDPEGIEEMKRYLELRPAGAAADEARKTIANPRRARESYAPDFSIATVEGEHIALQDLRGKVVLLDFWGTWCGPCVESVPSLRDLNKRYAKEPFVIVGISSDNNEEEWRSFVEKNKMVWPQYLDRDDKIQQAFRVRGFPTYVLIDHEGIVRFRTTGASWMQSAAMSEEIKKRLKILRNTPAADSAPR